MLEGCLMVARGATCVMSKEEARGMSMSKVVVVGP